STMLWPIGTEAEILGGFYISGFFRVRDDIAKVRKATIKRARELNLGEIGANAIAQLDDADIAYVEELVVAVVEEVRAFIAESAAEGEAERPQARYGGIIGASPAMTRVFDTLDKIRNSE